MFAWIPRQSRLLLTKKAMLEIKIVAINVPMRTAAITFLYAIITNPSATTIKSNFAPSAFRAVSSTSVADLPLRTVAIEANNNPAAMLIAPPNPAESAP